jgi:MFS family permease
MVKARAERSAGPAPVLTAYVGVLIVLDLAYSTAVTPLLPHYAHVAGLSKAAAGLLMAAYPIGSILGSLPGGMIAARLGSRAAVLLGVAVEGAAGLPLGWSGTTGILTGARLVQGAAGSCIWAAGMAWLAGAAPPERRGQAVGRAMGFAAAGTLAGPAIGAFAIWAGPGTAFGAAAAVSAALMIAAFGLPRPQDRGSTRMLPDRAVWRDRGIGAGFLLILIGGMGIGTLDVLAPLRLSQLGATAAVIGVTYLAAGAAETALSPVIGRLSDRRGEIPPARLLLAAGGAVSLLFPVLGQPGILAAVLAAGLPVCGSLSVSAGALLSGAADRLGLHQGVAFGIANLAWSGGQAVMSVAAGAAAQATSDVVPEAGLAVLFLAAAVALAPGSRLRPALPSSPTARRRQGSAGPAVRDPGTG